MSVLRVKPTQCHFSLTFKELQESRAREITESWNRAVKKRFPRKECNFSWVWENECKIEVENRARWLSSSRYRKQIVQRKGHDPGTMDPDLQASLNYHLLKKISWTFQFRVATLPCLSHWKHQRNVKTSGIAGGMCVRKGYVGVWSWSPQEVLGDLKYTSRTIKIIP